MVAESVVATFTLHSGVEEIFAVEVIEGIRNPLFASATVDDKVWIVPDHKSPQPVVIANALISADPTELAPSNSPSAGQLKAVAEQLSKSGRLEEAWICYDQAIAISSAPAPLLVDTGNLQQDFGHQESARLYYERAHAADPNLVPAIQNRILERCPNDC